MIEKEKARELIQEAHPAIEGEVLTYLTEKIAKADSLDQATEQVKALTPTTIALSYADARVNQAQKKWSQSQRKEETQEEQEEPEEPKKPIEMPGDAKLIKALTDKQAKLESELAMLKGERIQEARSRALDRELEGLPDYFTKPFKRIEYKSLSDEEFNHLIEEVRSDITTYKESQPKGLITPPRAKQPGIDTGEPKVSDAEIEELVKLTDI